jgi:hypothetical protein
VDFRPVKRPAGASHEPVNAAEVKAMCDRVLGEAAEEIRQVAVGDEDGDAFEAWERTTTTADMRSVWAHKTSLPDWTWEITVAALEFVREDPLESRLRGALRTALQAVPGATAVSEEHRETLQVAGHRWEGR